MFANQFLFNGKPGTEIEWNGPLDNWHKNAGKPSMSPLVYLSTLVVVVLCCFCLFVFYNLKEKKLCATHHGIQSCLNHNMPFCWGNFQIHLDSACKPGNLLFFSVSWTCMPRSHFSLGIWNILIKFVVWTSHNTFPWNPLPVSVAWRAQIEIRWTVL